MTLAEVLAAFEIDTAFSSAERTEIEDALTQIYQIPSGRVFLEGVVAYAQVFSQNGLFKINKETSLQSNTALDSTFLNLNLDDTDNLLYADNFGTLHTPSLERILIHEFHHATLSTSDPDQNFLFTPDFDYQGVTVSLTNGILNGLETERIHYFLTETGGNLSEGENLTFGNEIDLAYIVGDGVSVPSPIFAPYDTSGNTNPTRDLLVGREFDEVFLSGAGDDYVYGESGRDIVAPGSGNDFVDGGSGKDEVNYLQGFAGSADTAYTDGLTATLSSSASPGPDENTFQTQLIDPWGDADTLVNIEEIVATKFDDLFVIEGSLSDVLSDLDEIDAEHNTHQGDTLDLSGVTDSSGATINLQQESLQSLANAFEAAIISNFENVIGTHQDDFIIGDDEDNIITGGAGVDMIDGGNGIDTALFDKISAGINLSFQGSVTGTGGDAEGDTYENVEVFIGTNGADTFNYSSVNIDTPLLIAGGSGSDELVLSGSGGGQPVIFWGGSGNDKIINTSSFNSLQVMVVEIPNLTEDNFSQFSLDLLGLGANFDWGLIDVVMINPDASDLLVNRIGSVDTVYETQTVDITFETGGTFDVLNPFAPRTFETHSFAGFTGGGNTIASDFDVDFGSSTHSVFGGAAFVEINRIEGFYDNDGNIVSRDDDGNIVDIPDGYDYTGTATNIFDPDGQDTSVTENYFYVDYRVMADLVDETADTFVVGREGWDHRNYDELSDIPASAASNGSKFFILGGSLNGSQISTTGGFTVTLPPPEDPEDPDVPRDPGEGSNDANYDASTDASNPPTYGGFDVSSNVLIISGAPIDPNAPPPGTTVQQVGSDVEVVTSSGSLFLADVDLSSWQAGAQAMTFGTEGDDSFSLTNGNDFISTGAGNDTINASKGNDTISYLSGDDEIRGGKGLDTLDLSQYTADQVTFGLDGSDVTVLTPDGTVTLVGQVHTDVGTKHTNIETLIFADAILDDAGIRTRAIGDQGTAGNDNVVGSRFNDSFVGSAGNDTVVADNGDDTITYLSGDDEITGGRGADTLDLSQYTSNQVTFGIDGEHVTIATPGGTITLTNHVYYEVGHVLTNIETLIFADVVLDDAGIRNRAMSDQGTTGNDAINGTRHNDQFVGSAGNDTVLADNGDDTITYLSGDDEITGGQGADTLDLSQYASTQVTFGVDGEHVTIATPDGTITLTNHVYYEVGNIRTNIETLIFADVVLDDAGIRSRAMSDQGTTGNDAINGTRHDDQFVGSAGNDTVLADNGDDTITYLSGDDEITGGQGSDTLDLSQYASNQVTFGIDGEHVTIATPDGTITLTNQVYYDVGNIRTNIETLEFSDVVLDDAGIRDRAILDQGTTGNDAINGTRFDDQFVGTSGNDTMFGDFGDDTFTYTSGDDAITGGQGNDTLDLTQYAANQVTFGLDGNDVTITTPDGMITLTDHVYYDVGNIRTNVETLLFSDGVLDDAGIRNRAINDENTLGSETIEGTRYSDLLLGGSGNDTLEGNEGADTFVFSTGDGADLIADFDDGTDVIIFDGGPSSFTDLSISDVNGNAVIVYNGADSVQLTGVSSLDLTEDDFQFI